MKAVETLGLTRKFGSITAVDHLDLAVEEGMIFGLLGPNGAGKTTLIRMLMGLLRPNEGSASVLGQKIPSKDVLAHIGYMTQSGALYPDLTARENVRFFAAMAGCRDPKRADEVLELAALTERANSLTGTLSGGLKQRLSLACALVHQPRLMLLDEPTVGVDPTLRVEFWRYFRELANQGVTLLVSSHVMDEAVRCDHLGFMRWGKLIAVGTPQELQTAVGASNLEEAFLTYAGGSNATS